MNGVFWIIDGEVLAVPFSEETKKAYSDAVAKSGSTFNHQKLWDKVKPKGCSKSFSYYPRGRAVSSNKGKTVIYLNPNIDKKYIPVIKSAFGIQEEAMIRYDYSEHYKCYLDK